jgi:hypothetical protein
MSVSIIANYTNIGDETLKARIPSLFLLQKHNVHQSRAPTYLSLAEALALVSAGSVGHIGSVLALHGNEVGEGDIAHVDLSKGPETMWNYVDKSESINMMMRK